MRYLVILALAVLAFYLLLRSRGARAPAVPMHLIRVRDIPAVLRQLQEDGTEGSFAGFVFSDPQRPGTEPLNVQFAVEGGRAGFDWLLLAQPNLDDEQRFIELTSRRGQPHTRLSANDVSYLRVESGDLAGLAKAVVQDLYGLADDDQLELVPEGFLWPPATDR